MNAVNTARTAVQSVAGVTLAPAVTWEAARDHANSNLPPQDTELASTLDGYVSAGPSILATRTAGDCDQYITAKLSVEKAGNGYLVKIASNTVIASDDAPVYDTCASNPDCSLEGIGLEGYTKVVKSGKVTFAQKEEDTFSLTTAEVVDSGITYPAGIMQINFKDLLGNMGLPGDASVEYYGFKDEDTNDYFSLSNIKGYFPFTNIGTIDVDVQFSKDGSISGSVVDNSLNVELQDHDSPTNYTLVKSIDACTYSISKKP